MLIPDSSGQKLVLRNVGRRESGLYICRVGGNIINSIVINSIVINSIVINIIVINNIANIIISMRLKNSLHISKVDDNIPIMIVTGLQYISLQLCGTCCFCIFCANFQFLAETKDVFPPFVGLSAKILYNRLLPRT